MWPRGFKEEVARDMAFKGLLADPDEVFALMKKMSAKYKIIEEERSRQRREKGDRKADTSGTGPPQRAGTPDGADQVQS